MKNRKKTTRTKAKILSAIPQKGGFTSLEGLLFFILKSRVCCQKDIFMFLFYLKILIKICAMAFPAQKKKNKTFLYAVLFSVLCATEKGYASGEQVLEQVTQSSQASSDVLKTLQEMVAMLLSDATLLDKISNGNIKNVIESLDPTDAQAIKLKKLMSALSANVDVSGVDWSDLFKGGQDQTSLLKGIKATTTAFLGYCHEWTPAWLGSVLSYCPIKGMLAGGVGAGMGKIMGRMIPGVDDQAAARIGWRISLLGAATSNIAKEFFPEIAHHSWDNLFVDYCGTPSTPDGWTKTLLSSGLLVVMAYPKQAQNFCKNLYTGVKNAAHCVHQAVNLATKPFWKHQNFPILPAIDVDADIYAGFQLLFATPKGTPIKNQDSDTEFQRLVDGREISPDVNISSNVGPQFLLAAPESTPAESQDSDTKLQRLVDEREDGLSSSAVSDFGLQLLYTTQQDIPNIQDSLIGLKRRISARESGQRSSVGARTGRRDTEEVSNNTRDHSRYHFRSVKKVNYKS